MAHIQASRVMLAMPSENFGRKDNILPYMVQIAISGGHGSRRAWVQSVLT